MHPTLRTILAIAFWTLGLGLIIYGSLFSYHYVLDKPLSVDAAREGVKVRAMSETELTAAVSTDEVELSKDGILQTRPSAGFCET